MVRTSLWLILAALTLGLPLRAAPQESGPAAYRFTHPEAKETWKEGLPADLTLLTPTCGYSKSTRTVYLLAELCGLPQGYEVEFFLLGSLSDRAYEALAIAWDRPSVIARAAQALGVPPGVPARPLRGLGMAQGERFTMTLRRIGQDAAPRPLDDFVRDDCSTPAQALFRRGFPFVGDRDSDDLMPGAVVAGYTEPTAPFGLPYTAEKGAAYGLFRAVESHPCGTPVCVALKWEQLPKGAARVLRHQLTLTAATLQDPEPLLAELRTLCESPCDVFLDVRLDPALTLEQTAHFAGLILALEAQGGFTLDLPAPGQIPLRAFTPKAEWRDRTTRVFQPWEIECQRDEAGQLHVTLCQIVEDWSVVGNDPALSRRCYPEMTPQTLPQALRKVDQESGKVYVAFFYCTPTLTVGDVAPYAAALTDDCPTQWIFLEAAPPMPASDASNAPTECGMTTAD